MAAIAARIASHFEESAKLKAASSQVLTEPLARASELMVESLRAGGKILSCGNGGSAADAQHFAAELVGRFAKDRAAWPAIALTTDASILTAVGNDFGFDAVFRRQVEAHGRPGDVAVGISTSGRSPNVIEALKAARDRGLLTVGLSGGGGGRMGGLVHYLVDVPSHKTPRIQEVHALVVHVLCQVVEEAMPA
jgi:D-sedoheptulose 7-phosphate isomerase